MVEAYVRRPPDPELLERLHERGLGEAGRRLREVLLGQHLEHPQHLLGGELGQAALGVLVRPLVASLDVDAEEPVEQQRLAGRAEHVRVAVGRRLDVDADLVEARLGHLRRDGALPDQRVQAELVAVERAGDAFGRPERRRRPDRLVRLLRVARARLVAPRLLERVLRPELAPHDLRRSRAAPARRCSPSRFACR